MTPGSSSGLLISVGNLFTVNSLAHEYIQLHCNAGVIDVGQTKVTFSVVGWLVVDVYNNSSCSKQARNNAWFLRVCECKISPEHQLCMPLYHVKYKQRSLCGMKPAKGGEAVVTFV